MKLKLTSLCEAEVCNRGEQGGDKPESTEGEAINDSNHDTAQSEECISLWGPMWRVQEERRQYSRNDDENRRYGHEDRDHDRDHAI